MKPRTNLAALALVLIGVCALKAALMLHFQAAAPQKFHSPDSHTYIGTAEALLQHGAFDESPEHGNVPQFMRTPGYPVFIALVFFFFGESYPALIGAQIVLSLGTLVLTYLLAVRLWDEKAALAAVVVLALDIPTFMSSQRILTETLFTFLLLLAVHAGVWALKGKDGVPLRLFYHGLMISLATLVRPVSYFLIPLLFLYFALVLGSRFRWNAKRLIAGLLAFSLPCLLFVGGWQLRNQIRGGNADLSYIQGVNMLFYRGAGIVAERDGISLEEAQKRLGYNDYAAIHPETEGWPPGRLSRRWKEEGYALIRRYPLLCVKTQILGFRRMMFIPGVLDLVKDLEWFEGKSGPLGDLSQLDFSAFCRKWLDEHLGIFLWTLAGLCLLGCVYLGVLSSLWGLARRGELVSSRHAFLWLIILYFIVISSGPEAYHRFRIPFMPLLSVYAGQGIANLFSLVPRRRQRK